MRYISSANWFDFIRLDGYGFETFAGGFASLSPDDDLSPIVDLTSLQMPSAFTDGGDPIALNGSDETDGATLAQDTIQIAGIDFVGDADEFDITLTDGVEYRISVEGISLTQGAFTLEDSGGNVVGTATLVGAYADFEQRAELVFTAPTGGSATDTYTIVVASETLTDTGSYAVSFVENATPLSISGTDTIAGDDSTSASVAVGDVFTGELNSDADTDWIAVTLTEGQWYEVNLSGIGGESNVGDPFLRIYDSNGDLVTSNDDEIAGTLTYSQATFQATYSGTYYMEADAFSGMSAATQTGHYAIQVDTTTAPELLDSIVTSIVQTSNVIDVYLAVDTESFMVPSGETWTSLGWDSNATDAVRAALDIFEFYTNFTFNIVGTAAAADWVLTTFDEAPDEGSILLGSMFFPSAGTQYAQFNTNSAASWTAGGLTQGGQAFATLLHEFGHGMGLAHPHDDNPSVILNGVTSSSSTGSFELNQGVYTVMSYNDAWGAGPLGTSNNEGYGWSGTLGALDIAALQEMYGAGPSANTGSTTYTLNTANASGTFFSTIWDTGGTDEIVYSGSSNATIDLREATLEYNAGGGGYVSYADGIVGGLTIANDVVIENASGGSGSDSITGNDAANLLTGNGGGDTLRGRSGNDILEGGGGGDDLRGGGGIDTASYVTAGGGVTLSLVAGTGTSGNANGDTFTSIENVTGSAFADTITGSTGDNLLTGGKGGDTLKGNSGNDTLEGGGGGDDLRGGSGIDTASYVTAGGGVTLSLVAGTGTAGNANGDTFTSIENVTGSAFADTITGSTGDNLLTGGKGGDTLKGNSGNDTLEGGGGGDDLRGGSGIDTASYVTAGSGVTLDLAAGTGTAGNANGDTFTSIENVTGSDYNDTIKGSSGDNLIMGGDGDDELRGRAGEDTLDGGAGTDALYGGSNDDTYVFAAGYDADTVIGFSDDNDKLDFSAFGFATVAEAQAFATQVGSDVVYDFGSGDTLTVENMTIAALDDDIIVSGGAGAKVVETSVVKGQELVDDAIIFADTRAMPVFALDDAALLPPTRADVDDGLIADKALLSISPLIDEFTLDTELGISFENGVLTLESEPDWNF